MERAGSRGIHPALVGILSALLPTGESGTISTLPIAWRAEADDSCIAGAAQSLRRMADHLRDHEDSSGRRIVLCLEPEPGCLLQESRDVIDFFDSHFSGREGDHYRRYLQVCHDTCHASVMGEDPANVLRAYADNQISVGKVQISSAIGLDFDQLVGDARTKAWERLQTFVEERYLHQTTWFQRGQRTLHEDLSLALAQANSPSAATGRWRIHFHVPLFLETIDGLGTTQSETRTGVTAVRRFHPEVRHFEVETYAWNVLPADLRPTSLAAGLGRELAWADEMLTSSTCGHGG